LCLIVAVLCLVACDVDAETADKARDAGPVSPAKRLLDAGASDAAHAMHLDAAISGPVMDAGDSRYCVIDLVCETPEACSYAPLEGGELQCGGGQSAVLERICGAYRERQVVRGFTVIGSYFRVSDGQLVARRTTNRSGGYCDGAARVEFQGDVEVATADCEPLVDYVNLCAGDDADGGVP
jgi:hypothetical protein